MRHHLLTYLLPLVLLALGWASCGSPSSDAATVAAEPQADAHTEAGEEVHLSHAQIETASIAWAPMSERPLKKLLKVNLIPLILFSLMIYLVKKKIPKLQKPNLINLPYDTSNRYSLEITFVTPENCFILKDYRCWSYLFLTIKLTPHLMPQPIF